MRRHYSPACWAKFHQNEEDCDEVFPKAHLVKLLFTTPKPIQYPLLHQARTATDVAGLTPVLLAFQNPRREFNMRRCLKKKMLHCILWNASGYTPRRLLFKGPLQRNSSFTVKRNIESWRRLERRPRKREPVDGRYWGPPRVTDFK